jgi:outer membrane protein OmpA-like peptidoglycan-associated protein
MPDPKSQQLAQDDTERETNISQAYRISGAPLGTPVVVMAVVVVVLLVALIVIKMRNPAEDPRVAAMRAELEELNHRNGSLGLSALGGGEQLGDIANRLKKDADSMVLLAERYKQLIDESNAEMVKRNAELLSSKQYVQNLTNELVNAKNESQQAKSSSYEAEALRREVATLKSQREAQIAEMATLKQQLAAAGEQTPKADMDDLQRRFEESQRAKEFFESRAKELEVELGKARLFAKSEDELLPAAVKLFQSLRRLENQPDSDISKAYSQIGVDLGANVLKTLTFPTGSAKMSAADEDPVRQLVEAVPDGDMLLVIGYASETGNVDGNRTLSSDRATAVAELLTSVKRPTQKVQAVYLGQTDRFSGRTPERNQLCEVWQIRGKQ